MNVVKPPEKFITGRRKIIYIIFLSVCVIAIAIAVYMQFFKDERLGLILGIHNENNIQNSNEQKLKANFEEIFTNTLYKDKEYDVTKIDTTKDIVYTAYSNTLQKESSYDLTITIPYINISSDKARQYNEDIQKTFIDKANSILKQENTNTIYSIDYTATIKDNILSVMIRSNLKEGKNSQRLILVTYNYNIAENREVTLQELLEKKQINIKNANDKIKDEIKIVEEQVQEFQNLGYSMYARNSNDVMYQVEKTTQFFEDINGNIYAIYPYGNDNYTTEMDMVIF